MLHGCVVPMIDQTYIDKVPPWKIHIYNKIWYLARYSYKMIMLLLPEERCVPWMEDVPDTQMILKDVPSWIALVNTECKCYNDTYNEKMVRPVLCFVLAL